MRRLRILLAGVGGQGTLTATNLLALVADDKDIPVTAGEIHGMAQRGGIVESAVVLGGYASPRIDRGEADILLGFEPLETLRALPYLHTGGTVVSNEEATLPVGVSLGAATYPDMDLVRSRSRECAPVSRFLPCQRLAREAGTSRAANTVLLGALCAVPDAPFFVEDLEAGIRRHLPEKIAGVNVDAARKGYETARSTFSVQRSPFEENQG